MRYVQLTCVGLIVGVLLVAGCNKQDGSKPVGATDAKQNSTAAHAPHGMGPNGGVVFDLGKQHAEFTVDHDQQQCTILVLGDDEKTPTPVTAIELVVAIKETKTADGKPVPAMTVILKPQDAADGKASKFVGTDPGIGNVADFEGTVSGEIDGKPAQGDFKE